MPQQASGNRGINKLKSAFPIFSFNNQQRLLWPNVWEFSPHTPSKQFCNEHQLGALQFNSDTGREHQIPQTECSVSQDCLPLRMPITNLRLTFALPNHHKSGLTQPPSWVPLICLSSSQNSGKHVYWLIIKDITKDTNEHQMKRWRGQGRAKSAELPGSLWACQPPGTSICSAV